MNQDILRRTCLIPGDLVERVWGVQARDLVEKRHTYKNFGDFTKNLWDLDFVMELGFVLLFFDQMIMERLVNWDRNSDEFVIEVLTNLE